MNKITQTTTSKEKNPIQVAERIFQVIETLSFTGSMGLIQLSNQLGLHKSTVHRILTSLIYMGYVRHEEETGKYALSFKLLEVSSRILDQMDILGLIHPYLKRLAQQTGETVHFVQKDGNEAVYIDKVESNVNAVRLVSRVGSHIPLYCSGVGKAILADMKEEEIKKIWESSTIIPLTSYTIIDLKELQKELNKIKQTGYAIDNEENELGVRCIAASILDYRNKAKYAFSISAPIARMTDEKIDELCTYILNMKRELSNELGYKI